MRRSRVGSANLRLKRCFDLVAAAFLLPALMPLIIVIAIAVKVDTRGPILYRCRRVGRSGRELRMLKFRKMVDGAGGSMLTASNDPRLTRIGALLAKTKLDEVPQLWNVLKGEMSLVGPRPEDPTFVESHRDAYDAILRVPPGITGLSQLAFAKESEVLGPHAAEDIYEELVLRQKLVMDRLYTDTRTLRMDACILWWTCVAVVLRKDVAVDRRTGKLGRRRRAQPPEVLAMEHAP